MLVFISLCLVINFQGYECQGNGLGEYVNSGPRKFILNSDFSTCILDNTIDTLFNKCVIKGADEELVFDYDFNEGTMYYFSFKESLGERYKTRREIQTQRIFPTISSDVPWHFHDHHEVVDLALDWVHYMMYVIDMKGKRLTGYQRYSPETQRNFQKLDLLNYSSVDPEHIAQPAGLEYHDMAFVDLQVDPYSELLFIQLSTGNGSSVILHTDLGGKNARHIPQTVFSTKTLFYVDVNELKLYVMDDGSLHIYDYDGRLKDTVVGPRGITGFAVFDQTLYTHNNNNEGDRSYLLLRYSLKNMMRVVIDNKKVALASSISVAVRFRGDKVRFMIFDARSKRRLINGTYICDRTNCQDSCEVTQTGESCVCRRRAQTQDGVTCYDCGQSNLTSLAAYMVIVGGKDASPSDFPWHSIIYELQDNKDENWKQICGGTLITSTVVLTAAHCVTDIGNVPVLKKIDTLRVALGKVYRKWDTNETSAIKLQVKEILPHESFMGSAVNFGFDIALLVLETKVNFTRFIMPACIDFNTKVPVFDRHSAYVPGFGFTEECGALCSVQSKELKYTKTNELISFIDCFATSQSIDHSVFVMLTPDKFCIGNGSASAVQKGDSGGGLTVAYKGLHYVTGIVSIKFVKLNRNQQGPRFSYSFGTFTNISFHIDWLKSMLPKEG